MSDDVRLDPDARHTKMELLAGGVRLQRHKVTGDEAYAWARKNKVDVPPGPNWLEVINTARLQRNLDAYEITAPPTRKPVGTIAPVSRDGHRSVAAAQQVHEDRPGDQPMSVVQEWARLVGFHFVQGGPPWPDQVNNLRRGLGLDPFRIKPGADGKPITTPGQTELTNSTSAAQSLGPIVSVVESETGARLSDPPKSQRELFEIITGVRGLASWLVEPQLAEWLLTYNTGNRPQSEKNVIRFEELLKANAWELTGEPIIVSREAVLNDGQHRLLAIVRTGIPAQLDIRFGIERKAFSATGTGTRRTAGHVLAIAGRPYPSMQAAIARVVHHYDGGTMQKIASGAESGDLVRMTEEDQNFGRIAIMARTFKFSALRASPFLFALVIAGRHLPFEKVEEFARLTDSGKADDDCATSRLHIRIRETRASSRPLKPIDVAANTVLAWNNWITGTPCKMLKVYDIMRSGEGFPKMVFGPAAKSEPPAETE